MSRKILITTSSFNCDTPEIKALENEGYEIVLNPYKRRLSEEEVKGLLTPEIAGMIAGVEPLTRDVLAGAKGLRVISRCGAGLDSVDMEAAQEFGITVTNTPEAPSSAVAELAVGLMLDALRGLSLQDRAIRSGGWERPNGGLLGARTVGIVGLGHIGGKVARYVSAFGAKVLACDPAARALENVEIAGMDELLAKSDIVSLHIPYSRENHHLLDAARLRSMKKGAILINTARGGLVDEDALYEVLKSGHLGAAALDVYEQEPYEGRLKELENIVLAAHVGSYAKETRTKQEAEAACNLLNALDNNPVRKNA